MKKLGRGPDGDISDGDNQRLSSNNTSYERKMLIFYPNPE